MAKLARAVILRDPNKARDLHFQPGEEPAQEYAVLIRNPACWEGGKLPTAVKRAIAAQDAESDSTTSADATSSDADPTEGSQSTGSGDESSDADQQEDSTKAAPAAKKTAARKTAATGRSRGRDAADEGTSGE